MGSVRLGVKIAVVLALVLAILVPLSMIRGTIAERQQFRVEAVDAVARSFAGAQGIAVTHMQMPVVRTSDGQAGLGYRDVQGRVE